MDDVVDFFRSIWGVWLMAIFVGIVVWVMWPSNRKRFERQADIPLDDDPVPGTGQEPGNGKGRVRKEGK